MVDDAPKAKWYFSDGFDAYARLWYHYGRYEVSQGKNDTYSVEADNAELRHYLARLARKSRCFSRCPYALQCAIKLFVFSFNRRQLHKQLFPTYQTHIKDFINPWFSHSASQEVARQDYFFHMVSFSKFILGRWWLYKTKEWWVDFGYIPVQSNMVILSLFLVNCQNQRKNCQKPPYSKTNSPEIFPGLFLRNRFWKAWF